MGNLENLPFLISTCFHLPNILMFVKKYLTALFSMVLQRLGGGYKYKLLGRFPISESLRMFSPYCNCSFPKQDSMIPHLNAWNGLGENSAQNYYITSESRRFLTSTVSCHRAVFGVYKKKKIHSHKGQVKSSSFSIGEKYLWNSKIEKNIPSQRFWKIESHSPPESSKWRNP